MELEVNDTKYGIKLGFGIVMKIQGMFASGMDAQAAAALADIDAETMDDIPEEHRHSVQANMATMPEVLKLCLTSVNNRPLSNVEAFVDEKLHPADGIKLFELVLNHINEMMVPKASSNKSTE